MMRDPTDSVQLAEEAERERAIDPSKTDREMPRPGDVGAKSTSYEKGRGVEKDDGVLAAAFDGNHGWFWRNRGKKDVTITLRTEGA